MGIYFTYHVFYVLRIATYLRITYRIQKVKGTVWRKAFFVAQPWPVAVAKPWPVAVAWPWPDCGRCPWPSRGQAMAGGRGVTVAGACVGRALAAAVPK